MQNFRTYGKSPFKSAIIHGGPGAAGEVAPVARELSSITGILEPLQTAKTIDGQIEELKEVLIKQGNPPMVLIGWSWGAWLSFVFTAQNPRVVNKLILVSSGPFEEKDAQNIMKTRLNRLNDQDCAEALFLIGVLEGRDKEGKDSALKRLGKLISKADAYDPIPQRSQIFEYSYDIYQSIWEQAAKLRKDGKLLNYGRKIQCPVIAIHGDFDPHPAEGIKRPLARILKDFRFIQLEKCGHTPWIENMARDAFYGIIKKELGAIYR
jgi:pimeloyl-ACP methyl ester carboxylesterase